MIHGIRQSHSIAASVFRCVLVAALLGAMAEGRAPVKPASDGQGLKPILNYISSGWDITKGTFNEVEL